MQKVIEDLRYRFRNKYFTLLLVLLFHIPSGNRKNILLEDGDTVLIGNATTKRNGWPLGVVLEIYFGKDDVSKVTGVKTYQGERLFIL